MVATCHRRARELLASGPYTIRGYYNVPEHNARAFTSDCFYRSGDIVRLSPGGNLIVEGRAKDLINRGGEKISAEEIENLVLGHPSVFNAAAVAMPDPVLGERTCLYVILRAGTRLTFPDLVDFLQAQLIAKFKLPERLEIVESFPMTSVGKVSKKICARTLLASWPRGRIGRHDHQRRAEATESSTRPNELIEKLQNAVVGMLAEVESLQSTDALPIRTRGLSLRSCTPCRDAALLGRAGARSQHVLRTASRSSDPR
jgi:hypothetical protein